MIVITEKGMTGTPIEPFGYVQQIRFGARPMLRLTRWLRAINVERYMGEGERHLDIGCGDGYFLRRSKCRERIGLDRLLGDDIDDHLDFPDDHFDYVTMLAVIEHIDDPRRLLAEIARVLSPGGRLVLTTPKRAAEPLIQLYVRDIDEQHSMYFDRPGMECVAGDLFDVVGYHTFSLGLNQAFCLELKKAARSADDAAAGAGLTGAEGGEIAAQEGQAGERGHQGAQGAEEA